MCRNPLPSREVCTDNGQSHNCVCDHGYQNGLQQKTMSVNEWYCIIALSVLVLCMYAVCYVLSNANNIDCVNVDNLAQSIETHDDDNDDPYAIPNKG